MSDPFAFSETLTHLVNATGYTPGQLAKLADLPKTTLVNWLNGRVKRPRHWEPLLKLGRAMRLTPSEMNSLLTATNHNPLHEVIPSLDTPTRHTLPTTWLAQQTAPFQPPPDVPHFSGRTALLTALQTALKQPVHKTPYLLQGMGGIGKTALAIRLAYLCQPFFKDGILWAQVNEANPMATLYSFAAAYGQDVSPYTTLPDRSRAIRGLLAHKQVLLILDNAESSEQLRPLLPPTGRAAVLITTRRHDLAILAGATRWTIPPLDTETAVQLFARFNITAEPPTIRTLAQTLGHHPLALTIAASRLAIEPGWTAAQFLQRLNQTQHQLTTLTLEDVSLQATFELSFTQLNPAEQTFFAALSIFAGPFTLPAACAAADTDQHSGADHLRRLVTLSLVQQVTPNHYTLHPLLQTFAAANYHDTTVFERTAAYFTHFLKTDVQHSQNIVSLYDTLHHLLETAETPSQQQAILPLIIQLAPYWLTQGLYEEAHTHLERGLTAADHDNIRAHLLRYRGELARLQQQMTLAHTLLQDALRLAPPHSPLQAAVLAELGVVASCEGQTAAAIAYFEQALATPQINENKDVLAIALEELGMTAVVNEDYQTAVSLYQKGLDTLSHHLPGGITLRKSLGAVYFLQKDYQEAQTLFTTAFTLAQEAQYKLGEITLLNNLAAVHMIYAQWPAAREQLIQAYDIAKLLNQPKPQILIEANLGHTYIMLGDQLQAAHHLSHAQQNSQQYKLTTIGRKTDRLLSWLARPSTPIPPEITPSVFI